MASKMAATLQICDIYGSICPTHGNEVSGCMFFGKSKLIKVSNFGYMQNLQGKIQYGVQNGCQKTLHLRLIVVPYIPVYNAMFFLSYSCHKKVPRIIHRCRI